MVKYSVISGKGKEHGNYYSGLRVRREHSV